MALANGHKVLYLKCLTDPIHPPPLRLTLTSRSSNSRVVEPITLSARFVISKAAG
jgi:hypothetical protein